ncbi:hypothetical protein A2U01_0114584, partial [Trifolium medium]|nr:hypothetical protein [Trifolium medium]
MGSRSSEFSAGKA